MTQVTEASDALGGALSLADAVNWVIEAARATHDAGSKLMFIGNGGSASIASHMAIDYSKNGNLRALAFNDGAAHIQYLLEQFNTSRHLGNDLPARKQKRILGN